MCAMIKLSRWRNWSILDRHWLWNWVSLLSAKLVQLICNKHMQKKKLSAALHWKQKKKKIFTANLGVWWMQTFSFQLVMLLHFNLNRLTTTTVCCWNFANLQWHAPTWINQKLVQELEPWIRRWVSCSVSTTNTLHWWSDERCSFKGNSSICLHSGCSLGSFRQRRRRGQWERQKSKTTIGICITLLYIQCGGNYTSS